MIPVSSLIQQDIEVLLTRALIGKVLAGFGADGLGLYGRSNTPGYYIPNDLLVVVQTPDDAISYADVQATVHMYLHGYDSDVTGHLMTDKNIEISINKCLQNEHMPCTWWWSPVEDQGREVIVFQINVQQLLG